MVDKVPDFIYFVKNRCPYCETCNTYINRGFLWSQLHTTPRTINVSHDKGQWVQWWAKVSPRISGQSNVEYAGTPAYIIVEEGRDEIKNSKWAFQLWQKAKGYRIDDLRDQVLVMRDSMEQLLWDEFPEYMKRKMITNDILEGRTTTYYAPF